MKQTDAYKLCLISLFKEIIFVHPEYNCKYLLFWVIIIIILPTVATILDADTTISF